MIPVTNRELPRSTPGTLVSTSGRSSELGSRLLDELRESAMRVLSITLCGITAVAAPTVAQEHQGHSPYAEQQQSGIASLTLPELEELRTGAGMGMARAAELNHYPGPLHALELADSLNLTSEQLTEVKAIRQEMLNHAVELGKRIIEAEQLLSRRFEHGHIDSTGLQEATANLGRLYGELRYVHLAAHLAMKKVLREEQVATYDRLRGYLRKP